MTMPPESVSNDAEVVKWLAELASRRGRGIMMVRCGDCRLGRGGSHCSTRAPCLLGVVEVWFCLPCAQDGEFSLDHHINGHSFNRIFWMANQQGVKRAVRKSWERRGGIPEKPSRIAYGPFLEQLQRLRYTGRAMLLEPLLETLSARCRCGHNPQATPQRLFKEAVLVVLTDGRDTVYLSS